MTQHLPNLPLPGASPLNAPELSWLLPYLMVWAAITIPSILLGWLLVFPKAGHKWWAAFIPGYNIYVLVVGVARLSNLWFVLVLIPGVQIIAAILVNVEVARRFGRSEAFGLGLALLGFVFYPILGLSRAEYEIPQEPLW
ncbi:MAG TPA: DUF5684 domain-containing protein [Gemmata sp.]|nr:DUF5684 domain-containing protein [Gemmata sp.]